jgi:Protein of unknown function (DUF1176)
MSRGYLFLPSQRCKRYFILSLALLPLQPSPSLAEPEGYTLGTAPEVEEFSDWSVSCDNGKRCEAINVSRERAKFAETEWGEMGIAALRVSREAGPAARARFFLDKRLWNGIAVESHRALTLHILYSGDQDRTGPAYRLLPLKGGQYEIDPRDVDAFLAESAKTNALATRMGGIKSIGSTRGMIAALRYMDEAQGRRDTVTAIYGKGPQPASKAPGPKTLPQFRVIKGAAKNSGTRFLDDELRSRGMLMCGVVAAPHTGMRYLLENGDALWQIDCGEEHTADSDRNPRSIWFFGRPGSGRYFRTFPRPEQGRAPLPPDLPNSSFDPKTGLLTATLFYGSNRDCGWRRQWGWDGKAWHLISARELHGCMGIMPEGWLSTWRSITR